MNAANLFGWKIENPTISDYRDAVRRIENELAKTPTTFTARRQALANHRHQYEMVIEKLILTRELRIHALARVRQV